MALVFVYGTLMRGGENHESLNGAAFLGAARTPPRFTLVDLGEYPALVREGQDSVSGELYDVDAALLARLDSLEEHPTVYVRETLRLEDGREAFTYVLPRERAGQAARIPGGDWRRIGLPRLPRPPR